MDNLLTRFGALDQDEADVADLCYRSGSGIGASCVPSTHVKGKPSLPSARWIPPSPKANHFLDQTFLLPTKLVPPPQPHNYIKTSKHSMSNGSKGRPNLGRGCGKRRVAQRVNAKKRSTIKRTVQCYPEVCHVFKSKGNSSKRTRAGAVAHAAGVSSLHHAVRSHRNYRKNLKYRKIQSYLLNRIIPQECQKLCWGMVDLNTTCLVFDGGNYESTKLQCPELSTKRHGGLEKDVKNTTKKELPWKCLNISMGDLWIADTLDPLKGITHPGALFTRIPRMAALSLTGMDSLEVSNRLCQSLLLGYQCQGRSLHRGNARRIFSDHKYVCLGVQPNRASHGVRDATHHREQMPSHAWNCILDMIKNTEKALTSFVQTDVIRDLNYARDLLKFKTMSPSALYEGSSAKIFGGVAFGVNVHLSCHTDKDYTYSIVSVHLSGHHYQLDDRIVAYFCFPRIGIAVALRPGDLLAFNPSEHHAISSRCSEGDQVYCLSMYLKTAVVGLNDNRIKLSPTQEGLCKAYNNR